MTGEKILHYQIQEPLGKGGMGEVFLATDRRLNRKVALKFLATDQGEDEEARRRFLQEARSAAALDHPFICKIYEVGNVDGRDFIAMEYVQGRTLGQVLEDDDLSLVEILAISIQIGEALEEAHRRGIIHRDLKPANVMVTPQGHAKVMDFGLAKQFGLDDPELTQGATLDETQPAGLTKTGMIVGTFSYMSPEQARGDKLDARSDVFAFGILLQELVTGTHPFRRETGIETLSAIMRDPPPELEREDVSPPAILASIVAKALHKDADKRYARMAEMLAELRQLHASLTQGGPKTALKAAAGGVTVLALILSVAWWLTGPEAVPPQTPSERTPVVIADFTGGGEDESLVDGVEEAVGLYLETSPFIDSLRLWADIVDLATEQSRRQAADRGARFGILGEMSVAGGGWELSLTLLDLESGENVVRLEETAASEPQVLTVVSEMTRELRRRLGDPLQEEQAPLSGRMADYEVYAAASQHLSGGRIVDAIAVLQELVRRSPDFALGHLLLGQAYERLHDYEQAERAYRKAVEKPGVLPAREGLRAVAALHEIQEQYDEAAEAYERLLQLFPSDSEAVEAVQRIYFRQRRFERAVEIVETAVKASPFDPTLQRALARAFLYAGDFRSSIEASTSHLEKIAADPEALLVRALARLGDNDVEGAKSDYEMLSGLPSPASDWGRLGLADLALYEGRLDDVVRLAREGIEQDTERGSRRTAARKYLVLAQAQSERGNRPAAVQAAAEAVALSSEIPVLYEAGRIFLNASAWSQAAEAQKRLRAGDRLWSRVRADLLAAEEDLLKGNRQAATRQLNESRKRVDTWTGRFLSGRLLLDAGDYVAAYSELDAARRRRGEALSLFLDDVPTARSYPEISFFLGMSQRGLRSPGADSSFQTYIDIKKGGQGRFVAEARRALRQR